MTAWGSCGLKAMEMLQHYEDVFLMYFFWFDAQMVKNTKKVLKYLFWDIVFLCIRFVLCDIGILFYIV